MKRSAWLAFLIFGLAWCCAKNAAAIDMSAVTGPLPGSVPTGTTCVAAVPGGTSTRTALSSTKAQTQAGDAARSDHITASGSIVLRQTWTNCKTAVPRSTTASAQWRFPFQLRSIDPAPTAP
ncbi:MAG: hypothetical protein JO043_06860 [Candidatus Eremiobacteraeota bacterium]|nr:hypothetical protein [Candidatus Eremiobacteraeota bacterium]